MDRHDLKSEQSDRIDLNDSNNTKSIDDMPGDGKTHIGIVLVTIIILLVLIAFTVILIAGVR